MPFRALTSVAFSTTASSVVKTDLTAANLGLRAGDVKDDFEWFRVSALRVRTFTNHVTNGTAALASGSAFTHLVAFDNSASGNLVTPSTFAQAVNFPQMKMGRVDEVLEIRMKPSDLFSGGPFKWFNTYATTGSGDASESSAGTVITIYEYQNLGITGPANTFYTLIEGIVEFHTPVEPTLTGVRGVPRVPRELLSDPLVKKAVDRLSEAVADARIQTVR